MRDFLKTSAQKAFLLLLLHFSRLPFSLLYPTLLLLLLLRLFYLCISAGCKKVLPFLIQASSVVCFGLVSIDEVW
jgi:hypothetical protein